MSRKDVTIDSGAYFYHQTILKMFVEEDTKKKMERGTAWFETPKFTKNTPSN